MSVWAAAAVGSGDCRVDPHQGRRFLEEGFVCEKLTSCNGTTFAELALLGVQQCFTASLRWTADQKQRSVSTRRDSLSLPEPCLTDAEVKMVYLRPYCILLRTFIKNFKVKFYQAFIDMF